MCKQSSLVKHVFLLPLEMCGPSIEILREKYRGLGGVLTWMSVSSPASLIAVHLLEMQSDT